MLHPKVLSIGEVLWDLFPSVDRLGVEQLGVEQLGDEQLGGEQFGGEQFGGEQFGGEQFGGAPANFACHAAIHGANVSMVSALGADRRGRRALEILQGFNIDVSLVSTVSDAPTGTVSVTVDSAGKPVFTIHENSAWDRIPWNGQIESRVKEADAIYFGTLGQRSVVSRNTIRHALQAARKAGIRSVVDINLRDPYFDDELIRESIDLANILKLSDDELSSVISACGIESDGPIEDQLGSLQDSFQLDIVVITRGARGAVLVSENGIIEQQGFPANVKDTVGAGDAFTAAFLVGVLREEPYDQVMHHACKVAAAACSHSGAVPS